MNGSTNEFECGILGFFISYNHARHSGVFFKRLIMVRAVFISSFNCEDCFDRV